MSTRERGAHTQHGGGDHSQALPLAISCRAVAAQWPAGSSVIAAAEEAEIPAGVLRRAQPARAVVAADISAP
jgi:hypothetical protein